MGVEIICGKCSAKIGATRMLKSVRDTTGIEDGRCPSCGHTISVSDFEVDIRGKGS